MAGGADNRLGGGLSTPVGDFRVEVRDGAVVASGWGACEGSTDDPVLRQALAQLAAYFAGDLTEFTVPIRADAAGLQARVIDAMRAIPFGQTRTYGQIAAAVGAPPQAVGQACGANPVPILIPCHRVLGAGSLGGFSAPGGIETKIALLRHEGAASLLI